MSTEQARSVLKKAIEDSLNEYTRGTLDKKVHIIDISYNSLLSSNKRRNTITYRRNYDEFLVAVKSNSTKVDDYLQALQRVNKNLGTCLLEDGGSILLVSKNFDTARAFITKISNIIKENDDFGIAFRYRNYQDIETSRSLARAKGSMFLRLSPKGYGVYKISKLPDTNKYGLVPVDKLDNVKEVLYLAQRRSTEYSKTTSLSQFNNAEVTVDVDNNVIIKKSALSVLDLGHGQGEVASQATPAGVKLSNLLSLGLSERGRQLVNEYMNELIKLHNVIKYEFKNTSNDTSASGYVVLSIQNYKRNNILSISEGAILAKLRKNIAALLPDIPGSNTIAQDYVEIQENKIVSILSGKAPKKIKKHNTAAKGSATPKIKLDTPSGKPVKTTRPTVNVNAQQAVKVSEQLVSLTNLQNLINQSLVERVKQNMGRGDRRDILNLRSGRFAESVKVERMTQSREGMITAFYSYMKNPYATFSAGGLQSSPRTRDPKLLIARSIRDIASQQVQNRLRSVSV